MRILALALTFLMILSAAPVLAADDQPASGLQTEDLAIHGHDGKTHVIHAELALGPADWEKGLMFRKHMAADAGMLFVFPIEDNQSFWMKNTLIPLDMLFVRQDGTISHIHANAMPQDLTPVPSNGAVLAVLELNAAAAARMGIHEGDKITDKTYFKAPPAAAKQP